MKKKKKNRSGFVAKIDHSECGYCTSLIIWFFWGRRKKQKKKEKKSVFKLST